jgi:curli biogenesis system outer membrane secretion channel CsgG
MKKTMFALAAVAVLAAPVVSHAQADTRPTVAVLPFDNGSVSKSGTDYAPLGKGIEAMLITELSRNSAIRVVERAQIQKLLDEQNLGAAGRVDDATAAKIGKILGAKHMVKGAFTILPSGDMRLDIHVVDVETSKIIWAEPTNGKEATLLDVIQQAGNKLSSGVKLPPIPPAQRGEVNDQQSHAKKMPLAAAMLYARAIEAEDSGKKAEAKQLYSQVQATFPYPPAKEAIDRLNK